MSDTKWTPGTWRRSDFDELGGYDCITGAYDISASEDQLICTLDAAHYSEADYPTEEMTANADLIAAAPELYEALERMVDKNDAGCVAQAKAAMAKARGEQ